MIKTTKDWNPETYARFRGFRLRPALDLLAQIPDLPDGDIVDLGCGNGAVAPALKTRFPDRNLVGIDSSPSMLEHARSAQSYDQLQQANAESWTPDRPPALIFSNALCHWLPNHDILFPRLVQALAPGGTLAVQMPRQYGAPSHALLRDIAAEMFPDLFDFTDWQAPVLSPLAYAGILDGLGQVTVWETEYVQRLAAVDAGHPVRHFTMSTAMRPFVEKLTEPQSHAFTKAYEAALDAAYPKLQNGDVFFPFRRVFFVVSL
ncbi:MAG: methyltransferase domain-containing protein [Marinosulfonomonas sp.]